MPRTAITDINTMSKTGVAGSFYGRPTTNSSDGTSFASADGAYIPAYNPQTDTILIMGSTTITWTIPVNTNNRAGRTTGMLPGAFGTGTMGVIPPNAIPGEVFIQSDGSLHLDINTGTGYVTVLRTAA